MIIKINRKHFSYLRIETAKNFHFVNFDLSLFPIAVVCLDSEMRLCCCGFIVCIFHMIGDCCREKSALLNKWIFEQLNATTQGWDFYGLILKIKNIKKFLEVVASKINFQKSNFYQLHQSIQHQD